MYIRALGKKIFLNSGSNTFQYQKNVGTSNIWFMLNLSRIDNISIQKLGYAKLYEIY